MARMKKLPTVKGAHPALQMLNPLELLRAYTELKTVEMQEQTKIQAIRAQRDIAIQELCMKRKFIIEVCERVFAERRDALAKFFDLLDKSVDEKDEKGLEVALRGIGGIVTTSPFMGFADFVKSMRSQAPRLDL